MFQSPSIRLYTSENAENTMQRKLGNNVLARKPFLDRSINSKTPDTGKLQKSKLNFAKNVNTVEKPKVSPKLEDPDDGENFTYSFKDIEDHCEDVWPKPERFGTENLIKILRNYCHVEDTPPPSPEPAPIDINPIFFELPDLDIPHFQLEEEPLIEPLDIDLPYFDDDELDISV